MPKEKPASHALSLPAVCILLSLLEGERHGYDIMRSSAGQGTGLVPLGPATLYGTIRRLLEQGLIEEAGEHRDPRLDDQRRRYYRITPSGRKALSLEIARYESLVAAGKRHLLGGSHA